MEALIAIGVWLVGFSSHSRSRITEYCTQWLANGVSSPQDMEVLEIGHGEFVFPTEADKTRIFQSPPWAFKSLIINLVPWELPSQDLYVFSREKISVDLN
ncbi:hypothetical protein LINGRAHAP2_LOCUS24080 [Linum grandiflorum]